jgi:hypothetical protein
MPNYKCFSANSAPLRETVLIRGKILAQRRRERGGIEQSIDTNRWVERLIVLFKMLVLNNELFDTVQEKKVVKKNSWATGPRGQISEVFAAFALREDGKDGEDTEDSGRHVRKGGRRDANRRPNLLDQDR